MHLELPDPVRHMMQVLTAGLKKILGDRLVAVYVGGSVAVGDYYEGISDIDFMVITEGSLSPEDGLAIGLLHQDLYRRFALAGRLEGDYPPRQLLIPQGTSLPVPGCEEGIFLPKVGEIMISADNLADIRENGVVFYGLDPREVLPTITPNDVRSAVRSMLADGLGPCDSPVTMAGEILDLLRCLCALETGRPTTKMQGARWALTHLEQQWHPAIQAAMRIRSGCGTKEDEQLLAAELPDLDRVLRPPCDLDAS